MGVMDKPLPRVKANGLGHRIMQVMQAGTGIILDQLYPPTCIHCDAPIAAANHLCPPCWRQLRPITQPMCPVLGLPFAVSIGPEARSAEAIADPPPFDRARAAVIYDEVARSVVSRLKYGDRAELARFCAGMMVSACAELLEGDPLLVPVPLHRFRQWQRRYNQSMELAHHISSFSGIEIAPLLVRRKRRTRQQVGLNAAQRQRNVSGAFSVDPGEAGRFAGRRILIVDDVVTTGATVRALTHALKRGGFDQIDVISFARVVIGAELTI